MERKIWPNRAIIEFVHTAMSASQTAASDVIPRGVRGEFSRIITISANESTEENMMATTSGSA
ncbi:unnamed protein product [Meloidogyne enterolobii]|uniref:Uncharacterized protein n=2 Tax=Meloidogyne enterolobii TaxID=390850 RepID=A0A6V7WNN4_MELEN|nr:unnamed protein product [Meloidogyne enterolobii]